MLVSASTYDKPEWRAVADALMSKYEGTKLCVVPSLMDCAAALRDSQARYAAVVASPEEIDYKLVNELHRATRKVDADIWGDCIWGLITGYDACDALRIAQHTEPKIIKRSLETTNVNPARFEHSLTITDWAPCEIMAQSGYQEAPKQTITLEEGMQHLFAQELAKEKPDIVITSAHATEFNLEMPFGEGLIYSYANRFYELKKGEMPQFSAALKPAREGEEANLSQLASSNPERVIEPDGQCRIWLAAGNCLFGHANRSKNSMAVTAASAYGAHQIVGYTVPSWYGDGGWGTLNSFFSSYDGISLSHAWYLNNQFILKKSRDINPKILDAEFNGEEIKDGKDIALALYNAGLAIEAIDKDAIGVVHDRDVVAFYGDPKWLATLDAEHAPTGLTVSEQGQVLVLRASSDFKGRFAYWYSKRMPVTSCNVEGAEVTNDFILLPSLELKAGGEIIISLQ